MNAWTLGIVIAAGCFLWMGLSMGHAWWYLRHWGYGLTALVLCGWGIAMLGMLLTIAPQGSVVLRASTVGGLAGIVWMFIGVNDIFYYDEYAHSRHLLLFRKPKGY
jgi:hypothetical protein